MRHTLDRVLTATPSEPNKDRIQALYGATIIACCQGHLPLATARVGEARSLVERMDDPESHGWVDLGAAAAAMFGGDWDRALTQAEDATAATENPIVRVSAMMIKGQVLEHRGDAGSALIWQEKALAITSAAGEVLFRSYALWSLGISCWRNRKPERAQQCLRQCLELAQVIDDQRGGAAALEALAWIVGADDDPRRAAVLMAAADALGKHIGASPAVLPDLIAFHDECECRVREALGAEEFDAAWRRGAAMDFDEAAACALNEGMRTDRNARGGRPVSAGAGADFGICG